MTTTPRTRPRRAPAKPWRINWQAIVGVLLIVAAAYTAGETYIAGEESQRRAECQSVLNRAFLESLQGRDRAAREESAAQRALLSTPQAASDREKQNARQRYVNALAELDRARSANPLPEETTC